jgi:hypothetical protein
MPDEKKPQPGPNLPKREVQVTTGAQAGSIPPPPDGVAQLPWDLFQILMKTCRGDTPPPRKDSFLPYIVIRAFPGDRGGRPTPNPWAWESPDIFVMPNQPAATAPAIPPNLGGIAQPGVPNTVYAHVWNLGRGPATNVRVEFYTFDATLGTISAADVNLVGFTYVSLGTRDGPQCHAVVHCPVDLVPGGTVPVLLVRAFSLDDPLGPYEFDSSRNRHVGVCFIGILMGAQAQMRGITLKVAGAQSAHKAQITVLPVAPDQVPWIQLLTMRRNHGLRAPAITPLVGITPPTAVLDGGATGLNLAALPEDALARLLVQRHEFQRSTDPMQVTLIAHAPKMAANEAHVARVQLTQENTVIGGFTVILLA